MDLSITNLRQRYIKGETTPLAVVEEIARATSDDPNKIWIHRLPLESLRGYANALEGKDPAALPLYGIPFAIKDNIDLAGVPTTAACPDFAYTPAKSAVVVQRLLDAGAIPIGKTNLDQFATGLVGARSPYGACRNSFNAEFVSGGSSSGSAVSVAKGHASFSLGTDTAGSGRVPASFNNLVGHKPTCGLLSATGMVPACRSLDTISIFTLTAEDGQRVLSVAADFDAADPFSRKAEPYGFDFGSAPRFRFGVPRNADLEFFGNKEGERLFRDAIETLRRLGGESGGDRSAAFPRNRAPAVRRALGGRQDGGATVLAHVGLPNSRNHRLPSFLLFTFRFTSGCWLFQQPAGGALDANLAHGAKLLISGLEPAYDLERGDLRERTLERDVEKAAAWAGF